MLLSAVSVLVVAQSISEVPEGLMNNPVHIYTVCPTRYRTRLFFNNSNTNEDIATKFEQDYVLCVRNEMVATISTCYDVFTFLTQ